MLFHHEQIGAARVAVTDRLGGTSPEPYAGLNLGGHVGDDDHHVDENRRRLATAVELPAERVLYVDQVHGTDVAVAEGPWEEAAPRADAVVTRQPSLAVAVLVADCVPVLLVDTAAEVVAAAHAGRRGLAGGVVPATISTMRELGAEAIEARLGPAICGPCYEVPESLRSEVSEAVPAAWATARSGGAALDLAAGVLEQLSAAGVEAVQVDGCSREDVTLYSYRRDRTTGRYAGLAWLAESER